MVFLAAFLFFFVGLIVRLVHDNGIAWSDSWLWGFSGWALVALGLFLYHGWGSLRNRITQ